MANRWSALSNFQDASEPLITGLQQRVNACLTERSDDRYNAKACPSLPVSCFFIYPQSLYTYTYRVHSRDSAPHGRTLSFFVSTAIAYSISRRMHFSAARSPSYIGHNIPGFRNAHSRTHLKTNGRHTIRSTFWRHNAAQW